MSRYTAADRRHKEAMARKNLAYATAYWDKKESELQRARKELREAQLMIDVIYKPLAEVLKNESLKEFFVKGSVL